MAHLKKLQLFLFNLKSMNGIQICELNNNKFRFAVCGCGIE